MEDDCVGGWSILLPRTPIFKFKRLRTALRRPKFPRLHTAGSRQWVTRLICRLTKDDQSRCFSVGLNPAVASRWIALEIENQFLVLKRIGRGLSTPSVQNESVGATPGIDDPVSPREISPWSELQQQIIAREDGFQGLTQRTQRLVSRCCT